MKYERAKYLENEEWSYVDLRNISEKEAKEMSGKICCPEEGCTAPLYVVHNSKDGGRTVYFKARNDSHKIDCYYRAENFRGQSRRTSELGYFTEKQINDYVRSLYRDVTIPIEVKRSKKGKEKTTKTIEGSKGRDDAPKSTAFVGRIMYGEETGDGVKGRMSRCYEVTNSEIGKEIGVYGLIKSVERINGQIEISFKEERNSNIKVLVGAVYENNNPNEFGWLDSLVTYFQERNQMGMDVQCTAAGLAIKYGNQLYIETQARHSFLFDGKNITKIVVDQVKE